jgi:hypothetical protein
MLYIRLGEHQENTMGRTPSKPLVKSFCFSLLFFVFKIEILTNNLKHKILIKH